MPVLEQCSICEANPMEPYETAGGTYLKCALCDAPDFSTSPDLLEEATDD